MMLIPPAFLLHKRDQNTARLIESPYDADLYLERAEYLRRLEYPDLAASDAYKALMLCDEILNESGDYHDKAVEANVASGTQSSSSEGNGYPGVHGSHEQATNESPQNLTKESVSAQEWRSLLTAVAEKLSSRAYKILVEALKECGDLQSAWDFGKRGCKALPCDISLQKFLEQALGPCVQESLQQNATTLDERLIGPKKQLSRSGLVRREIYPWNSFEPERFSPSALSLLNAEIAKVASKIEIRAVDLPLLDSIATLSSPSTYNPRPESVMCRQLGLFATSDISPGEQILLEPSILTANNRLHDPLCDACSSPLPAPSPSSPLPSCPSCEDDTVFCSTSCLDRAQALYHPAICGLSDFDHSTRDPSPTAATNALYLLLVARTIAMAQTQDVHPLSLREIEYLWGEFNPEYLEPPPKSLPFSFETNIAAPIHLLEKLDLDIFAPETVQRYDTWVINTLMAKFRGVASAKMNPRTGMPEVCAVHWRWCLANHSCAPNVRWEWPIAQASRPDAELEQDSSEQEKGGGSMAFYARGGEEVVQWGPDGVGMRSGGIKRGEEVMSHYCDVGLPVEARREWASGALGGICACERCRWESDAARTETLTRDEDASSGKVDTSEMALDT